MASPVAPTDDLSRTVTLPPGFAPVAGYRNVIVGQYTLNPPIAGQRAEPVQIFDVATGGIVDQLAGTAEQFLVSGSEITWQPVCDKSAVRCEIHRYDMDSRQDRVISDGFNIETQSTVLWRAISPDGNRIAMLVPKDPAVSKSDGSTAGA